MSNILITGISGSGGSYLAEYIVEEHPEYSLHGVCRWHATTTPANLEKVKDKVHVHECDLLDLSSIIRTLKEVQPSRIFHLAAYANVRKCFITPLSVINNNVMGTANLLEAIRLCDLENCKIQICSSSEVYGNPKHLPITEEHLTKPVNPYAMSKLAQESLAYSYYKSWGLNVIITRAFGYINPRRTDLFASNFAKQVVEIEKGKRDVLKHGNLKSTRTLMDVRDVMRAYWIACDVCKVGEPYNIGSEDEIAVGDFLELLKQHSKIKIKCKEDPDLIRPIDISRQVPDTTKFDKTTRLKPKYSLNESIDFLLNHYRKTL